MAQADPTAVSPSAPYVVSAEISSAERRRLPSLHYAYVIRLGWSNGNNYPVLRSHLELFNFHVRFSQEQGGSNLVK